MKNREIVSKYDNGKSCDKTTQTIQNKYVTRCNASRYKAN